MKLELRSTSYGVEITIELVDSIIKTDIFSKREMLELQENLKDIVYELTRELEDRI